MWAVKPDAPARHSGTSVWLKWPSFARWREQQLVAKARREASVTVTLDEARTRKALAEAELAEIALATARSEIVAMAEYETALGRILDRLMARLRSLPVRLAHFGPDAEATLEAEVERVVQELAAWDEDVVEVPEEGAAAGQAEQPAPLED
jgi:hypothetical protein